MSTIWTPGGEYVPRREEQPAPAAPPGEEPRGGPDARAETSRRAPTPDEEAMMAEAQRVRDQILATPAADVVANHAIGLFEVAALHLGADRPKLEEAQFAIDAMAALVETLGPRLGRHEHVLRDGLAQLRLAFVEAKAAGPAGGA